MAGIAWPRLIEIDRWPRELADRTEKTERSNDSDFADSHTGKIRRVERAVGGSRLVGSRLLVVSHARDGLSASQLTPEVTVGERHDVRDAGIG